MNIHLRNTLLLSMAAVFMLTFAWVGYMASDDGFYAEAAEGWLNHFPFVGDNHWSLRHPFVMSVALSFAGFGVGEYSLVLVTTAFFLATVAVAYLWVSREFGPNLGLWVGLVLVSTPLFAVISTISGAEMTEVFFVLLSLSLFHRGIVNNSVLPYLLAGLAAGLAVSTRETSVALLLLYTVLFLFNFGGHRARYLLLGLGFAIPVLAEMSYLWFHTGDWLYRLNIDLNQGQHRSADYRSPATGNVDAGKFSALFNPLLSLLVNQEFMLLFFLLIPAAVWVWRSPGLTGRQRNMLGLLVGVVAAWVVTIGYLIPVRQLPRYYTVATLGAGMVVAVWIALGLWAHKRFWGTVVGFGLLSTNLLSVYVENKDPIFGERAFVEQIPNYQEKLYTDQKTYYSSGFLLREHRVMASADHGVPENGGLYLYNPNRVLQDTRPKGYVATYSPREGWREIARIDPGRKWSGYVLEWLGLTKYLPQGIVKRLDRPVQAVVIYRVPGA